ncbi:MAG: hypothetical protein L0Y76_11380 [Ignavibacteria bacterium]|nr:hypothetical protein [Ignavibacteria bacterium]
MRIHFILISAFIFLVSGCGKENQEPVAEKKQGPDNSSVIISYDVSGGGSGTILMTKKGPVARFEIKKVTPDGNNIESMFYADNYLYFYLMVATGLQPVKMKVVKDINYRKSFASFIDAAEYTQYLTADGKEIICGKECEKFVYKPDGSAFSVYNKNYVMKAAFDGTVIMATSINENPGIDDNYVRVPADLNFIDLTK